MTKNAIQFQTDAKGIAWITLNRPEVQNAIDEDMVQQLTDRLVSINQDQNIQIVILQAAGRNFSAGADLHWMQRMVNYSEAENLRDSLKLATLMSTLNTLNKPTIALVNGATYGGGNGLVACCDIVIAEENAVFCFSEVKLGLIPAIISPYVINVIGQKSARRYFLTAERFNSTTANELGLVDIIVAEGQLLGTAEIFINYLLQNSAIGIYNAKKLIASVANKNIDESLIQETAQWIARMRVSSDAQTRMKAFLQK